MNPNLASLQSTADLRTLLRQYENPKTPIQGLILRGIESEITERGEREPLLEIIARLEEENEKLTEEIDDTPSNSYLNELEDNIKSMKGVMRQAMAGIGREHPMYGVLEDALP